MTLPATTATIVDGQTGTVGPVDVSNAGSVVIQVSSLPSATYATSGAAYASYAQAAIAAPTYADRNPAGYQSDPTLVFEESLDGVNWAPLPVTRHDLAQTRDTFIVGDMSLGTSVLFSAGLIGTRYLRCVVTSPPVNTDLIITVQPNASAQRPATATVVAPRTPVFYYLTGQGITTTETVAAVNTVADGKTLVFTGLMLNAIGHPTGVTQGAWVQVRLRYAPNGVTTGLTTSSPALFTMRIGIKTEALRTNTWMHIPFEHGVALKGVSAARWGYTHQGNVTTLIPTLHFWLTGYFIDTALS